MTTPHDHPPSPPRTHVIETTIPIPEEDRVHNTPKTDPEGTSPFKNSNDKKKKKRGCGGKIGHAIRSVLLWRMSFARGPPLVFMASLVVAFFFVAWLFHNFWYNTTGGGTQMFRWFFFIGVQFAAWTVFAGIIGSVLLFFERKFFFTSWFYYLNSLNRTIIFIACVTFTLSIYQYLLPGLASNFTYWIRRVFLAALIIALVNVLRIVLTKYFLAHVTREHYWNKVSEALFKENLLQKMRDPRYATKEVKQRRRLRKKEDVHRSMPVVSDPAAKPAVPEFNLLARFARNNTMMASISNEEVDRKIDTEEGANLFADQILENLGFIHSRFSMPVTKTTTTTSTETNSGSNTSTTTTTTTRTSIALPNNHHNADADALANNKVRASTKLVDASGTILTAEPTTPFSTLHMSTLHTSDGGLTLTHVLTREDMRGFVRKRQLDRAMHLFDTTDKGHITAEDIRATTKSALKERKYLASSLRDREDIAAALFYFCDIIFYVLVSLAILITLGLDPITLLSTYAASILAFSFAFGNSMRRFFESVIYVFFMRNYDIGDPITLDGKTTVVIEKLNILTTIAYAPAGNMWIIPNHTLCDSQVITYKGHKDRTVETSLSVDLQTSAEMIANLKTKMQEWIDSRPKVYKSSFDLNVDSVATSARSLTLNFGFPLINITFSKGDKFPEAKNDVLLQLTKVARDLGIKYSLPVQKVVIEQDGVDLTK